MRSFFVFTICLLSIAGSSFAQSKKQLKLAEAALFKSAQDKVLYVMKDPESTRFRNLYSTNGTHVCGEFNSKNSNGGYVGFMRFVVTPEGHHFAKKNDSYEYFDYYYWDKFCVDATHPSWEPRGS
jgi:hypothetical protein